MNKLIGLITAAVFVGVIAGAVAPASVAETTGTITIPIKEFDDLKKSIEAEKEDQYWNMTFLQILNKENNDFARAWEKYEFWGLRHIYLTGNVTDGAASALIGKIEVLNQINFLPIKIIINSGGGSVFAGFNILNAMNNSFAQVNTECDGMALSMAAVILSNGGNRLVNQGCIFMIHEVSTGSPTGQTTVHIKFAETVINVENILAQILSENSGLSVKDVRAAWEYETFYDAYETVALGFADKVAGTTKRVAVERIIPDDLLPLNKMRSTFEERLTK